MPKSIRLLFILALSLFWSFSYAQKVGIGLVTPAAKLHVKGSTDITQLIIDANSSQTNTSPLIKLRKSDGTDLMWIHTDHTENTFIGLNAGRVNNASGGAIYNSFIGSKAGYWNSTGEFNTAGGTRALYGNETGNNNTAFGSQALNYNETGHDNTAIGYRALFYNSKGNGNTAVGSDALHTQSFYAPYNYHSNNVAVGFRALYFNEPNSEVTGIQNTGIGTYALTTNITGANNTAIGYNADVISGNLTNATAIGYNAKVASSNTLVLGGTGSDAVNVGIGTTTPNARLEIIGALKVVDGTQGAGKILTSNETGLASWQPPPPPPPPPIVNYPVVWICCNPWMTKNLDVSTYRNGDPIPIVTDAATWAALTTGAYCYYNNDSTMYAATYGKLYNWYAVNDPRGLAPEGWHIPSDFEWTTLGACLGGDAVAGGPMKEIATTHWNTPNEGATNFSNFTGLPGGSRVNFGPFANVGYRGSWWSSTELNPNEAWNRELVYHDDYVFKYYYDKRDGFSVRCLRD